MSAAYVASRETDGSSTEILHELRSSTCVRKWHTALSGGGLEARTRKSAGAGGRAVRGSGFARPVFCGGNAGGNSGRLELHRLTQASGGGHVVRQVDREGRSALNGCFGASRTNLPMHRSARVRMRLPSPLVPRVAVQAIGRTQVFDSALGRPPRCGPLNRQLDRRHGACRSAVDALSPGSGRGPPIRSLTRAGTAPRD